MRALQRALRRARCSAKQGRGGGGEFTSRTTLLPSSLPRTSLQTDQEVDIAKTCSTAKSGDDGRVSDKKYRGKKVGLKPKQKVLCST